MLTHQLIRGESSSLLLSAIERRRFGGYDDASGQFEDEPALRCEVWPGGDLPVVAEPAAAWEADDAGRGVAVTFTEAVTAGLPVGWYKARVVTDDEARDVVAAFMLTVLPGPGSGELRPAYHTYDELLTECSRVESCIDEDYDRGGFAQIAARSRDWVDAAVADWAPCRLRSSYAAALADGHLVLDTPAGRMLAEASMYRTISVILRRAPGDENRELRDDYDRWANETLERATAAFAESTGLAPVRAGGFRVGRLTR